jgi:LPXTG-motif cell wall-anchored protein
MLQVAPSARMTFTALAIGMAAAVLLLPAAAKAQDKDCRDFTSQSEAQAFFESIGGSASNNADNLDANHNGVACEVFPYATSSTSSTSGDLASTGFDAWELIVLGIGGLGLAGVLARRARRLSHAAK